MEFEWDDNKNRENIKKHGISFKRATKIFISGNVLEWIDNHADLGEERIIALGRSERTIFYVVYTWRGNARRIISARRATKNERRKYLAVYP